MDAPVRPVPLGWPRATFDLRPDGTLIVQSAQALGPVPARFTVFLERWARDAPDRCPVLVRDASGAWAGPTYAETLEAARAVGAGLLARGLDASQPVAILCANGIPHLLLLLGCLHVGIPAGPISPAYCRGGADGPKLRHCLDVLSPGLVMVADEAQRPLARGRPSITAAEVMALAAAPCADPDAVAEAAGRVGPDSVAKVLFTSGSTGEPKGVITTHGMLCSNQEQLRHAFPVLVNEPPVLVDWLPWNHVFGGSHNLGLVIANGGTLHVDDGRPLPGQFGPSAANLREVAPTFYFNVPQGYAHLAAALEADAGLGRVFFSRMRMLFYAAASLPQSLWDRMDALAVQAVGERIQWMTGLGSTETAPFCLSCRPDNTGAGVVGLPVPGVTLKLAPVEQKFEARVRGPNVTPGYWRDPVQTAALFDSDGYLRMGDALLPVDPADLEAGFRFDGRVAEDFKLSSGTWVSVGPLRLRVLEALAPHVRDVAIAGLDRDYLAVLAIPHDPASATDPAVRQELEAALRRAAAGTGSSLRIQRLHWLTAPLSIDTGELTDKGSLNQRGVLRRHAALVERLYADPPPPEVICIP